MRKTKFELISRSGYNPDDFQERVNAFLKQIEESNDKVLKDISFDCINNRSNFDRTVPTIIYNAYITYEVIEVTPRRKISDTRDTIIFQEKMEQFREEMERND